VGKDKKLLLTGLFYLHGTSSPVHIARINKVTSMRLEIRKVEKLY
jgi:hypothetical protein